MQRLFQLAEDNGTTIILIHHGNKKGQEAASKGDRPTASVVSGAAAITNVTKHVTMILVKFTPSSLIPYLRRPNARYNNLYAPI